MFSEKITSFFEQLGERLKGRAARHARRFMRHAWRLAGAAALTLVVSCLQAMPADAAGLRPNIILIVADDMGYGDVGFNGQTRIRTPHMDALATQGMVLDHHYAGAPTCSPSRASLMTGMHVGHCKVNNNGMEPLRPEDRSFAEVLQGAGYHTHFVGKWGLGGSTYYPVVEVVRGDSIWAGDGSLIPGHLHGIPTTRGFHSSYGYLDQVSAHFYFPEFLHRNIYRDPLPGNLAPVYEDRTDYSQDFMTEYVKEIIENATIYDPFFIKYSMITPHRETKFPRDPNWATIPPTGPEAYYPYDDAVDWLSMDPQPLPVDKAYASMITFMDDEIGQIVAAVQANASISDNTIIIVTSDNGPQQTDGHTYTMFDSSGGLREFKFHLHEGGIRVPFVAVWPGKIPAGVRSDHPSYFADYMATFADLAGAPTPSGTDGLSFLPTLLGEAGQEQHEYMVWTQYGRDDRPVEAIRKKETAGGEIWKLLRWQDGTTIELYNLAADPAETTNVAAAHPAVVAELTAALDAETTGPKSFADPVLAIEGDHISVSAQPAPAPCARPAVTDDTIAYWRLDNDGQTAGNPATTVVDETGNHDGTASASPLYTDITPNSTAPLSQADNDLALTLNGTNQNIIVSHHADLDLSGDSFTLEAWVRIDDLNTTYPLWVFYKKPLMTSDLQIEYSFLAHLKNWIAQPRVYGKTDNLTGNEMGMVFSDGSDYWVVASDFEITDNGWHYISASLDHERHEIRFVLDDQYETVYYDGNNPRLSNSGNLVLGGHHNLAGTYNHFFPGALDEIRISRGVVPPHRLLNYPLAEVTPQVYDLDFGAIPYGSVVTQYFRVANNAASAPVHFMAGHVAADCLTDPRLSAQTGAYGPVVDGAASPDFGVAFSATAPGDLVDQYIDVTAFLYSLGGRVPDAPAVIRVLGEVIGVPGLELTGDIAVSAAPAPTPNPRPALTPDTAAYWRFEGGIAGQPAGTVLEERGLHAGAVTGGPVYVDSVGESPVPLTRAENELGLEFDGEATQYVSVSPHSDLALAGDFTVEAWVRLHTLAESTHGDERQWILFRKVDLTYDTLALEYGFMAQMGSWAAEIPRRYGKTINATGREIGLVFTTGAELWSVVSHFEINDHDWHYISAAFDESSRTVRFVMNDQWETIAIGDDARVTGNGTLHIGCHRNVNGTYNQFLRGALDELRLSNAVLPIEDLLNYPPQGVVRQAYEMDLGTIPYGGGDVTLAFQTRNTPPSSPAGAMHGAVSAGNATDARLSVHTGLWGPLAESASSGAFEITLTPNAVGVLNNQYVDVTAFVSGSGQRVPDSPATLLLTGEVVPADQTITFEALADKTYGDAPFDLSATASSGLPVAYVSNNPGVASVSGSAVTIHAAGAATITASQPGDVNYNAAPPVEQTLTVNPAVVTVNIINNPTRFYEEGNTAATLTQANFEVLGVASGESITITQTAGTYDSDAAGPRTVTTDLTGYFAPGTGTLLSNYSLPETASGPGTITDKLIPEITVWPTASPIIYGQSLNESSLDGGSALYDGAPVPGIFSFTAPSTMPNAGIYSASVIFTPDNTLIYATVSGNVNVEVAKEAADVLLTDLAHTYDGNPKSAAATTDPPGLVVAISYNGSPTAPTDAGSYAVVATITDPNYAGDATGTLIINKAEASVSLSDLNHVYDGSAKAATAATTPSGLAVTITYNGSATVPTNAGSYAVEAVISDTNYAGNASATLNISKATPSIITYPTASDIFVGQSLADSELTGGAASVPGNFAFTLPGETPDVGTENQSVTFTPTDTANYNTIAFDVSVTVLPAGLYVRLLVPDYIEAHAGDNVRLEVEALNATGVVTYTWLKNGLALQDENDSVYQIASVVAEDAGYYRCEVADESKAIASSPVITLVVLHGLPVAALFSLSLVAALSALAGIGMLRKKRCVL